MCPKGRRERLHHMVGHAFQTHVKISKLQSLLNLRPVWGQWVFQIGDQLLSPRVYSRSLPTAFVEIWIIHLMGLLFQQAAPGSCLCNPEFDPLGRILLSSRDLTLVNWGLHLKERHFISLARWHIYLWIPNRFNILSSLVFLPPFDLIFCVCLRTRKKKS